MRFRPDRNLESQKPDLTTHYFFSLVGRRLKESHQIAYHSVYELFISVSDAEFAERDYKDQKRQGQHELQEPYDILQEEGPFKKFCRITGKWKRNKQDEINRCYVNRCRSKYGWIIGEEVKFQR